HLSAPRMEHSAKPPIVRDKLVELVGDIPRIELFARGVMPDGWQGWGNQCVNGLQLHPALWSHP
ncbi:MT-A70 family methyltransferase, partial [Klebsiella pneumoniae]